ncbi:MAG: GPW/gp25 family protein [Eubacteriales bacterium]
MATEFVTANTVTTINLAPETEIEEILQNIATLLATPKYSVPLDRGFGLTQTFLDKPHSVAKTLIISDILDAIEKYEPRVTVIEITFETSEDDSGVLIPIVEVEFND